MTADRSGPRGRRPPHERRRPLSCPVGHPCQLLPGACAALVQQQRSQHAHNLAQVAGLGGGELPPGGSSPTSCASIRVRRPAGRRRSPRSGAGRQASATCRGARNSDHACQPSPANVAGITEQVTIRVSARSGPRIEWLARSSTPSAHSAQVATSSSLRPCNWRSGVRELEPQHDQGGDHPVSERQVMPGASAFSPPPGAARWD